MGICTIRSFDGYILIHHWIDTAIHRKLSFHQIMYVFQIVPGTVILKNRDARQLRCLGLNAIQKVAVGRHGVIFALQLAEQAVLCVQVIREYSPTIGRSIPWEAKVIEDRFCVLFSKSTI